jgi:hypothetical protein
MSKQIEVMKQAIIEEASIQMTHPSKDARWFAKSVYEYLVAEQPAPAQPLTDEQIEKLREKTFSTGNPYCPVDSKSMRKAARAIEAAHGITSGEATEKGGA